MEVKVNLDPPEDLATELLVHVVAMGQVENDAMLRRFDSRTGGRLLDLLKQEGFAGRPDQRVWVTPLGMAGPDRLLIMGCKPGHLQQVEQVRNLAAEAAAAAVARKLTKIACLCPSPRADDGLDLGLWGRTVADGAAVGSHKFAKYRNVSGENGPSPELADLTVCLVDAQSRGPDDIAALENGLCQGLRIANAVNFASDLVNEPPERLIPTVFGEIVQVISDDKILKCHVMTQKECEQAEMRLLLAVSKGSEHPPCFIHLTYSPASGSPCGRVVLIGKGITFDSGGLNLKAAASMAGMKSDMAGGAAVAGVMTLLHDFDVPLEVHGLIPCAENMVSGASFKVGDVVQAKDGTWVEVTNTDAEGRLVLADALVFGRTLEPDIMVDLATLTGASMVALGKHTAAVMGTNPKRVDQWMAAARRAGESTWPLPLLESLEKELKSQVADVKNSGSRWGGSITAALFLKRFVGAGDWVHVDIAGPAFRDKPASGLPAGGTGFGVRTLLCFLEQVRP